MKRTSQENVREQAEWARTALELDLGRVANTQLAEKYQGQSALEQAKTCLSEADKGRKALSTLGIVLRRLVGEIAFGEYRERRELVDKTLLERADALGRIRSVSGKDDTSPHEALKRVENEQQEVLRALIDEIDIKVLGKSAPSKPRSQKR